MNCIICNKNLTDDEQRVLLDHCLHCDVDGLMDPTIAAQFKENQPRKNTNLIGVPEKIAWAIGVARARKEEW